MSAPPQSQDGAAERQILLEMRKLRIEGLTEGHWKEIVHGVDVTLHRGEVLGLIGESGAGKTTIGLAAMGFARDGCRIAGGNIVFDGIDLLGGSERARRALLGARIAYVAQSAAAAFNPAHRLIDQHSELPVYHGVSTRAEAEADARALYARLRLPEPGTIGLRYPHQVSGGQLQRAMTAMAMSCRPDLIVFDEPTTALDVTTQIEVLAAIKDVVEQFDASAIYISHDLALVAQMADRIMVLRDGNLVEEGATRELLSAPREDYTRDLLGVRTFRKAAEITPEPEVPLLEVKDVSAAYGRLTVLHGVNCRVPRQRTVALVGESGSGKSTTARVIAGLLAPSAGQVLWQGSPLPVDFRRRTKAELRQVQMIYQMPDTALNPKRRVRDAIGRPLTFYLGMRGAARDERLRELLSLVELEPDRFIDRLPGGIVGRGKATRVHRPRARRGAGARDLRRDHLGARSARGRGSPQASRPTAARAPALLRPDNPRHCHGARNRGRRGGHVPGPGSGLRREGGRVLATVPRVHGKAARLGAGDGPRLAGPTARGAHRGGRPG